MPQLRTLTVFMPLSSRVSLQSLISYLRVYQMLLASFPLDLPTHVHHWPHHPQVVSEPENGKKNQRPLGFGPAVSSQHPVLTTVSCTTQPGPGGLR